MAEEKKTEGKSKSKSAAAPAEAGAAGCRVDKCKQPVRAKGFCRKHYIGWRRGAVGEHHRYKTCSKEGCRKPRELGGLCAEHAGKGQPAEGGGAGGGAPAA